LAHSLLPSAALKTADFSAVIGVGSIKTIVPVGAQPWGATWGYVVQGDGLGYRCCSDRRCLLRRPSARAMMLSRRSH
jgi:hypothetical protein